MFSKKTAAVSEVTPNRGAQGFRVLKSTLNLESLTANPQYNDDRAGPRPETLNPKP